MLVMQHCRPLISMYQSLKILTSQFQKMSILTSKLLSNKILRSWIRNRDMIQPNLHLFSFRHNLVILTDQTWKQSLPSVQLLLKFLNKTIIWIGMFGWRHLWWLKVFGTLLNQGAVLLHQKMKLSLRFGAWRMPWLCMWSRIHAGRTHFLILGRLLQPELLGKPWQGSTNLKVLTQVAGNLDHSIR